jgi:hypothetical protein
VERLDESPNEIHFAQHHRKRSHQAHRNRVKRQVVGLLLGYFRQQNEESESKSNYQDGEDEQNFNQRLQNFQEHHDINSDLVESLQIQQEIEPGEENCERSGREENVAGVAVQENGRDHDDSCGVEEPRHEVNRFQEVVIALLIDLHDFTEGLKNDVDENGDALSERSLGNR